MTLVIFTCPRGFKGRYEIAQNNSIGSWKQLQPCPKIVLLGDDEGVKEAAEKHNCVHIPEVERNKYGTPLIYDLFGKTTEMVKGTHYLYANSDIMLFQSLLDVIPAIPFGQYLGIGRRQNVKTTRAIEFTEGWDSRIIRRSLVLGRPDNWNAKDYFLFSKDSLPEIPKDFAVGRYAWDSWLVSECLRRKLPVVNLTPVVCAIHQAHAGGGDSGEMTVDDMLASPEIQAIYAKHGHPQGNISQSNFQMIQSDFGYECYQRRRVSYRWNQQNVLDPLFVRKAEF